MRIGLTIATDAAISRLRYFVDSNFRIESDELKSMSVEDFEEKQKMLDLCDALMKVAEEQAKTIDEMNEKLDELLRKN